MPFPECVCELVPRHRSALLGHELGKQQPTLPAGEALLVDHETVALDCDPTGEKDLSFTA